MAYVGFEASERGEGAKRRERKKKERECWRKWQHRETRERKQIALAKNRQGAGARIRQQ